MNYKATLEIYENPEKIYSCLISETGKRDRSSFVLKKAKDHLKIKVLAKDATALRAALNSITQLLSVYKAMNEIK